MNMPQTVELICEDILEFLNRFDQRVNLLTCMGDTLAHLPSYEDVAILLSSAKKILQPHGKLIFSFRDSSVELKEADRFIHVKSDSTRSLTCFIERMAETKNRPEHILVHDILLEKTENGWQQKVSAYPKLILSQEIVSNLAEKAGLIIARTFVKKGMIYLALEP